jgi:hypothetical protein
LNTDLRNHLVPLAEASKLLAVSLSTAYAWAAKGKLPIAGRRPIRVTVAAVEKYTGPISQTQLQRVRKRGRHVDDL